MRAQAVTKLRPIIARNVLGVFGNHDAFTVSHGGLQKFAEGAVVATGFDEAGGVGDDSRGAEVILRQVAGGIGHAAFDVEGGVDCWFGRGVRVRRGLKEGGE